MVTALGVKYLLHVLIYSGQQLGKSVVLFRVNGIQSKFLPLKLKSSPRLCLFSILDTLRFTENVNRLLSTTIHVASSVLGHSTYLNYLFATRINSSELLFRPDSFHWPVLLFV